MAYDSSNFHSDLKQWAQQAIAAQWLKADTVAPLLTLLDDEPPRLLLAAPSKPLIVAFMGGTGVGKSSLLNRLAGQAIANAGVERPTSREVTLYHHYSVRIEQLPPQLPLEKIRIAQHQDEAKKAIFWLDMPDFDSTEPHNKHLMLQWLPHIDLLLYVVSPERYRDHKAWQILLAEGARHGWIFVLNQWDKGNTAQYEDFHQQLHKAGFAEPLIFRTICTDPPEADEFAALLNSIQSLASETCVQQLVNRQNSVKNQQLKQQLQACQSHLAPPTAFAPLQKNWQTQWTQTAEMLTQGFTWALQHHASRYARGQTDVMMRVQPLQLWDEWAQTRWEDALENLILTAESLHIASAPLKNRLAAVRKTVGKQLEQQTEWHCRLALAKPGNAFQRGLLKLAAVCAVVLPLATLSAVAYQVFVGYYQSYLHHQPYLGVDFVAHSSLLIIISGLLPYFIQKQAQPSLEKTALRGLEKGLNLAMQTIAEQVKQEIILQEQQQKQVLSELKSYITACDNQIKGETIVPHSPLARVLTKN